MSQLEMPESVAELKAHRKPIRNVNREHAESLTRLEKVALAITNHVGTMGFFLIIVTWTAFWLGWNFLAPKNLQFDPPMAFVFWLFISNMIQIFLMPLLMVGQNLQGRHADLRAESDFEINVKAEREVETILRHLEHQNELLYALMEKVGLDVQEVMKVGRKR